MTVREQITQMQEQTIGKIALAIGGGGSVLDHFMEWEPYVDMFIKYGNAMLIAGGLYLMAHNVINKRRQRKRRKEDVG